VRTQGLRLTAHDASAIAITAREVNAILPSIAAPHPIDDAHIVSILELAHHTASLEYSVNAAQVWGGVVRIPSGPVTHRGGPLPCVRHNWRRAPPGIDLMIPAGFYTTSTPPPLRTKYIKVAPCVHKLLAAQLAKGTVLIIPLSVAQTIEGLHYSCQHWTPNKSKEQGRIICDVANAPTPDTIALNGNGVVGKELLRSRISDRWQPIHHPTLSDMMQMILAAAVKHGWHNILLWKKDLQGAFNLLWFSSSAVRLLAFPLTNDLVVFHLAGMFG
jgi:hypothetical protein